MGEVAVPTDGGHCPIHRGFHRGFPCRHGGPPAGGAGPCRRHRNFKTGSGSAARRMRVPVTVQRVPVTVHQLSINPWPRKAVQIVVGRPLRMNDYNWTMPCALGEVGKWRFSRHPRQCHRQSNGACHLAPNGICFCASWGGAMTLRTSGKGRQHRYYTCSPRELRWLTPRCELSARRPSIFTLCPPHRMRNRPLSGFALLYGFGVPEGIRTPDLRFRKPLLYPPELPGRDRGDR